MNTIAAGDDWHDLKRPSLHAQARGKASADMAGLGQREL
jgi:hypothetical protein